MSYSDVLDQEATWFGLDLAAQGVPSLTPTFAVVTPHLRRLSQRGHALYLTHGPSREAQGSRVAILISRG